MMLSLPLPPSSGAATKTNIGSLQKSYHPEKATEASKTVVYSGGHDSLLKTDLDSSSAQHASSESSQQAIPDPSPSEFLCCSEDQQMFHLEKTGALTQVVGSQSLLSQELAAVREEEERTDKKLDKVDSGEATTTIEVAGELMPDDKHDKSTTATPVESQPESTTSFSSSAASAASAAHRYGLILTQEEAGDGDKTSNRQGVLSESGREIFFPEKVPATKIGDAAADVATSSAFKENVDSQQQQLQSQEQRLPSLCCPESQDQSLSQISAIARGLTEDTSSFPSLSQDTAQLTKAAGFGSLLDAIDLVEEKGCSQRLHHQESQQQESAAGATRSSNRKRKPSHRILSESGNGASEVAPATPSRAKRGRYGSGSGGSSQKKRQRGGTPARKNNSTQRLQLKKVSAVKTPDQEMATRAADLAARTVHDADLQKRLLLSMALVRENPRSAPSQQPGAGFVLQDGFVWAHYPVLEAVLKTHMAEYYELSISRCQSAQQQSFNNDLVRVVREAAGDRGWSFSAHFTDKVLRDRIRCYYKTHIQNAKKRLRTMLRNPTKRANARHLMQHYDLIQNTLHAAKTKSCDCLLCARLGGRCPAAKRKLDLVELRQQQPQPGYQHSYNGIYEEQKGHNNHSHGHFVRNESLSEAVEATTGRV